MEERVDRMLRELTSPATYSDKPKDDMEAVERGLCFILQLALDIDNFKRFGSDVFLTFYDVATTAEEPLRKFALLRAEVAAQIWLQNYPSLKQCSSVNSNTTESNEETEFLTDITTTTTTTTSSLLSSKQKKVEVEEDPTADEILDFVMGIYALERVGIGHDSKEEVRNVAKKYTLEDFFDIDAFVFQSGIEYSKPQIEWREYTQILTYSFYAEKTGIDIHISLSSVLKQLYLYRPYKTFRNLKYDSDEFDSYADQLTMVFNIIHVLSNYGELRLSPGLVPQEYSFLSDESNLQYAIDFRDVHLVGEICHCLRVLGTPLTSPLLLRGLTFLRSSQRKDGSWPARDDAEDNYFRYHACMCAISALNPQRFRGYGPSEPKILNLLLQTRYAIRTNRLASTPLAGVSSVFPPNVFGENILPVKSFDHIHQYYHTQANIINQEVYHLANQYGDIRLVELLKEREISGNDLVSGSNNNKSKFEKEFRLAGQKSTKGSVGGKKRRRRDEDEDWRPSA